jgi:dihydrodipicolinate synthase/N-acetylneuraminate lyase
MTTQNPAPRLRGVIAPVLTPLDENHLPDKTLLVSFCQSLLDTGCHDV